MSDIEFTQLRRLDMTLLLVFAELVRQRKMTIVAQRFGLTQSAISHSLKRLRDVFQDELFRRAKAEAALQGRKLKDLIEEGLHLVLDEPRRGKRSSSLAALTKRAKGVIPGACAAFIVEPPL